MEEGLKHCIDFIFVVKCHVEVIISLLFAIFTSDVKWTFEHVSVRPLKLCRSICSRA